ncbi:hypothetical protein AB1Y20_015753 [Prymnesium parvum]|uniref:N-acetylglucosamine-6-phosphate deacetylase n=1 Tax=Prymnesium parvum TaxID=97485 RepID=A0AB34JYT4_PRYPA
MHASFTRERRGSRARLPQTAPPLELRTVRFTNCRVLRGHALTPAELWVRGGTIVDPQALFWQGSTADQLVDCGGCIVAPGYIDVQINGGFGADFSTPDGICDALSTVAAGLLRHGVTAFLPTVISSSGAAYRAILPHLVPRAGSCRGAAVLGVHLEGPFISRAKPGCHPLEHLREPREAGSLRRACGEHLAHVKMVTLAPELRGSEVLVAELRAHRVIAAAGHSEATIAQLEAAQAAGVSMCTHLFNAMPPFRPEAPGLIGTLGSSARPAAYFGLIADGIHVHPASLKIAARARPDGVVLVTDAMAAMGLPPGRFCLGGVDVQVLETGEAYRVGTNTLAGATIPLDECVRRYKAYTGSSAVHALEAAALHPAQVLNIHDRKGALNVGSDADFIFLDDQLNVLRTYIGGELVWDLGADGAGEAGAGEAAPM